jgi:outer membrane immunogenic protein
MKLGAFFSGAAICTVMAFTAQAADITPQTTDTYYPAKYDWSGLYVGGHVGVGQSNATWSDPFSGLSSSQPFTGFLGGAQIGVNYQLDNVSRLDSFVFGIEADVTGMALNGSNTDAAGFGHNIKSNWSSTITGRVGYAFYQTLIYAKGGVAFAEDNETFTDTAGNSESNSTTRVGWTAGGGMEYAFNQNWSVRLEYDYLGLGSQNVTLTNPVYGTGTANINFNIQRGLVGVNYRF